MASVDDEASELEQLQTQISIAAASKPLAVGTPGECSKCGDEHIRLVGGACPRCRDKWKLP